MGHNPLVPLTDVRGGQRAGGPLRLVLFSGGRGAGVLTRQLVAHPSISLTIAINGYDDGASTGEVRRFLGDASVRRTSARTPRGSPPSSGRAPRARRAARSAAAGGLDGRGRAEACSRHRGNRAGEGGDDARLDPSVRRALRGARAVCRPADGDRRAVQLLRLQRRQPGVRRDLPAIGRDFNRPSTITARCSACRRADRERHRRHQRASWSRSTPTAGCSAAKRKSSTRRAATASTTSSLIDRPHRTDRSALGGRGAPADAGALRSSASGRGVSRSTRGCAARSPAADLIIYAPGTQHSSLFPSYLTPGLSDAIAGESAARSSCSSPTSRRTPRSPAAAPSI